MTTQGNTQVTKVKPRAAELFKQLNGSMYRMAYENGQSLSSWLESQDPSSEYQDGLDAFGRMLREAGIKTRSVTQHGVYADQFLKFEESEQARALVPEYMARVWRGAQGGMSNQRATYLSTDYAAGSTLRPYAEANALRVDQRLEPASPLSELVAITTPIDSDSYRSFYIQNNVDEQHLARVAEGAEVPRVKLVGGQNVINLKKYGRGIEVTYEQLRRMRLDIISFHIERLAVQAEMDKVAVALSTLINGDGNANTAATSYNLTTLDPAAVAGTLSLPGWLRFKMQFKSPYTPTTVLGQEGSILKLWLLNTGSANIPLVTLQGALGVGGISPINRGAGDGVRVGWLDEAPTNKLVAFDNRMALERVTEINANITEVDKWIARQTEFLVMTEVEGFGIFDANATKILNIGA
jgi:hypothetical protein